MVLFPINCSVDELLAVSSADFVCFSVVKMDVELNCVLFSTVVKLLVVLKVNNVELDDPIIASSIDVIDWSLNDVGS